MILQLAVQLPSNIDKLKGAHATSCNVLLCVSECRTGLPAHSNQENGRLQHHCRVGSAAGQLRTLVRGVLLGVAGPSRDPCTGSVYSAGQGQAAASPAADSTISMQQGSTPVRFSTSAGSRLQDTAASVCLACATTGTHQPTILKGL